MEHNCRIKKTYPFKGWFEADKDYHETPGDLYQYDYQLRLHKANERTIWDLIQHLEKSYER